MRVLPAYMYVNYVSAGCPPSSEEGIRFPGRWVRNGCGLLWECVNALHEQVHLAAKPFWYHPAPPLFQFKDLIDRSESREEIEDRTHLSLLSERTKPMCAYGNSSLLYRSLCAPVCVPAHACACLHTCEWSMLVFRTNERPLTRSFFSDTEVQGLLSLSEFYASIWVVKKKWRKLQKEKILHFLCKCIWRIQVLCVNKYNILTWKWVHWSSAMFLHS